MLTPAQKVILRTMVMSDPTITAIVAAADDIAIAAWLNTPVVEKCWKTSMDISEVHDIMDWTEFIGRSVGEKAAFTCMFVMGFVNPSRPNIRSGLNDIFSGTGAKPIALRAAFLTIMQRPMTRAEKTVATGPVNGTYTLTFEGELSYADASELR
ncbi:MAG: hypothetical protein H7Y05_14965 [Steroidobacteraceae bacterium]|nr:hypothetical protein [Deltaproteobacteria bacterium]